MNEVIQAMLTRRSCRAYTPEQIQDEQLEQILLADSKARAYVSGR